MLVQLYTRDVLASRDQRRFARYAVPRLGLTVHAYDVFLEY